MLCASTVTAAAAAALTRAGRGRLRAAAARGTGTSTGTPPADLVVDDAAAPPMAAPPTAPAAAPPAAPTAAAPTAEAVPTDDTGLPAEDAAAAPPVAPAAAAPTAEAVPVEDTAAAPPVAPAAASPAAEAVPVEDAAAAPAAAPPVATWGGETAALQDKWLTLYELGRMPCPVLHVLSGWTSSSTIAWAEPVHISRSARVSHFTQGYEVPRGGTGVPMESVNSMMVGFDESALPCHEVRGIAACLKLKQPVYAAVVALSIQETTPPRPFMPVGILVTPENLPRDYSVSSPGLLSGRDFRDITSPVAYACIPRPWSSVLAAVKWANREFNVAITPRVFCNIATVLWNEDPVTHRLCTEWDIPREVTCIPHHVLCALAEQHLVPWSLVYRIESDQCAAIGAVSAYSTIAVPWTEPM